MSYSNTIKDKKEEDKLIIARIEDKIKLCNTRNKIFYMDFMQLNEKSIALKYIKENNIRNYIFFGGVENADREILIFYPEKITEEMARENFSNILAVVKIDLPVGQNYEHREYLSGIMKLGIKREKFGDIIVRENGADIIALKEIAEYFVQNLKELTRFQKSEIYLSSIDRLEQKENKFEELKVIVPSIRLDNFVSELAHCSRGNAKELLVAGKVFVNGVNEFKDSKKLQVGDVITIRGKGKFIFESIEGSTRSDRTILKIKKYC
jgi:RNA-binding protein YlmH